MIRIIFLSLITTMILLAPQKSFASDTDVTDVKVTKSQGKYRFDVTLHHADTGWEHYANKWEIVGMDGVVLGTRILAHPHVNEQPFTRSLGNVALDESVKEVLIRAGDNLGGKDGITMKVKILE